MKRFSWIFWRSIMLMAFAAIPASVFAVSDLAIPAGKLWFNVKTFTEQAKIRIYATVQNNGDEDMKGIVRFFDGVKGPQLKGDQPVSVVAGKDDTVFVDIIFAVPGDHEIVAKIFPLDKDANDSNNEARKTITILRDFDRDGSPNAIDQDDDNDGVLDVSDAFPQNPNESLDSDSDGKGNNEDADDDNDGVLDVSDAFPLDASESKDTDRDGIGDAKDAFPENPAETSDFDKDGVGDNADFDADNDGIPKSEDTDDQNLGPVISAKGIPAWFTARKDLMFDFSETFDPDGSVMSLKLDIDSEPPLSIEKNIPFEKTFSSGKHLLAIESFDDRGESRLQKYSFTVIPSLLFMGGLFAVLFMLILAIFGILTYASHTRKSGFQKTLGRVRKTVKKLKRL